MKLFADKEFNRKLLGLTLPIALQSLMLAMVAAADALMLGAIEQDQMSAVSLATQIQFVQNMLLSSYVGAIVILGSQYYGKGNTNAVNKIFCIGLRLSIVTSAMFFIGCVFFPEALMTVFTDQPVLNEIGSDYLRIAGWSYLLTGISQCQLATMKISTHEKTAAVISSVTVIVNIFLNAVFIFGLFGLPALNAKGAATATLISRIIEVAWTIGVSLRKDYLHPPFRYLFSLDKVLLKDFFKCMLPIAGASLLWGVGFTAYSSFMGHLGPDATAANSVAAVVRDLICCLCNGIASAGGILVGYCLGRGDLETGKIYGKKLAVISFIIGGFSTVIMLALTPIVLSFVKLSDGARRYLLWFMVVMAFYMIGRAVNTIIITGVFYSGGDVMFDTVSLLVTMWGMAIPLALLGTFVFDWSPIAVYAMTCLDEVGKIPWVMYHFKKYKWLKDLTKNDV